MADQTEEKKPASPRNIIIAMDGSSCADYALDYLAETVARPPLKRSVIGSILLSGPSCSLGYFPFQPVVHNWFIKGRGYCDNIKKDGDHVVLVHVPELNDMLHSQSWNNSVYVFDRGVLEGMITDEQKRIQKDLEKFAEKLKHHGLGGKVKSVMAAKPGEGIIKACVEENGHLIVSGTRGMGTVRRTLMGSVSDYLVHHSNVPVLICRRKEDAHH